MNSLISISGFIFLTLISTCFQDGNEMVYGDWHLNSRGVEADFHLRISTNNKVLFRQEIYKTPCMYNFDGDLKNDTIFYTTILTCQKFGTKIQEHKWTQLDTFLIKEKSSSELQLLNIKNQEIKEYIKPN